MHGPDRVAINYDKLVNWPIPEVEQRLTRRDTILYALGVGLGADACDPAQLRFVYEEGLQALPTMAIILGYPGAWHASADIGITRSHVVHGEQGFRIVRPLPVEGDIVGKTRVTGLVNMIVTSLLLVGVTFVIGGSVNRWLSLRKQAPAIAV